MHAVWTYSEVQADVSQRGWIEEDLQQQNKQQKVPRARLDLEALTQCPFLWNPCVSLQDTAVMSKTVGSCHFLLLTCVFLYQCQQFSCLPLSSLTLTFAAEDTNSSCMWTPQLPCSLEGFSRFSQPGSDA